jgi:predicted TIM-barrel fold metal-dependent hydrolase
VLISAVAPDVDWIKPLYDPVYDPIWKECEELGLPVNSHGGTGLPDYGKYPAAALLFITEVSFYSQRPFVQLLFSGVFERHPRLTLAIVEFELSWAPHILTSMDYTYRERHGEAIYRFKDGWRPSDFFHRNVVLSFQEDAIGIRLRDAIGVDNMMWGSDYPHSESTFPRSRKILAEILAGVPEDEQAKIVGGNTARVYGFDVAKVAVHA